jgi:hypothetical protein
MARKTLYPAIRPWENRYRTPAAADLIAELEPAAAELFRHVRSGLTLCAMGEVLAWHGIPWRWSFRYSLASDRTPVAYLVPQPDRAILILPLPASLASDGEAKYSRHIRDVVALTPPVGGVRWTHWPLSSRSQADELILLARRSAEDRGVLQPS